MKTIANSDLEYLIEEIREEVRATAEYTGRYELDARVIEALRKAPRELFVASEWQYGAYCNIPLPIGHGQTISQPYVVALMTDLIQPGPDDVILEVGTGSGYQAAVIASLAKKVYSLEIVEPLALAAGERLRRLGYGNVDVRFGNGCFGLPECAPYDAVVVTAAASQVPPALIDQLKTGGRLVMPIGNRYFGQALRLYKKDESGLLLQEGGLPVMFVPLTGVDQCCTAL